MLSLSMPSSTVWIVLATSYLLVVRVLRYRRLRSLEEAFGPDELRKMTPAQAQKICHVSLFYETPTTMHLGTQVALFKVWGIPTIASILLKAGELKSPDTLSRRLIDTGILISTWITNPLVGPGSGADSYEEGCYSEGDVDPRGAIAVARVNWLHRKYPIRQDDYRYNLALFVLEPIRWTARFGWRVHGPVEQHAFFVFWMEIGRRMGIENLWSSLDEMKEWAEMYEVEHMVPSESSAEIAQIGVSHFAARLPNIPGLRSSAGIIIASFLDERTRRAMMLPEPSPLLQRIIEIGFRLQSFIIRHACLPRRTPSLWVVTDNPPSDYLAYLSPGEIPRLPALYKRRHGPWYYPEPTGIKRNIQDFLVSVGWRSSNLIPGKRWKSDGYRIEELGPPRFENYGHEEVIRMAEEIQGIPVRGPWALHCGRSST